ncbi:phage tail assembly chaperone [Metapseudomonas otitidis]|uniref:phage tail assembly chaperone n=1 Tax=Metapseudomonas otitidis TaxID=319939 RepID=UPI00367065D7
MPKFVLDPAPTFKAHVDISQHGGGAVPVLFEFKHRTRDALDKFLEEAKSAEMSPVDEVLAVAVGWELEDAFNAENIEKLLQNYQGAGIAVARTYIQEIRQVRLGN